jgi:hypothetical protein
VKRDLQFVGIFSENGEWRLDIGTNAMKKLTPKTTETWATKLVIRRLDATGMPIKDSGPVCEEHVVGIFSEDSQYRLDIGTDSMKRNCPGSVVSWATKLKIHILSFRTPH